MMKWLREHSKKIMVGLVLFAMFSFIGGSALTSLIRTDPSDIIVMSAFNTKYTLADIKSAERDTQILERLLMNWNNGQRENFTVRHWLMCSKEAERAGIAVSSQDVNEVLNRQEGFLTQLGAGDLADVRKQLRASQSELQQAVGRQLAINQNFQRVELTALPSEPQVRHYVKATEDKISIGYAALDAEKFVDPADPVTPEELQTQFEKYKDVTAADGPDGFGYKHPDRVRLQYVSATISKIESQVEVSEEEVKNYWKSNQSKFTKTIQVDEPVTPASAPAGSQPASQPATTKVSKTVPKTFTESRDEITRTLKTNKATRLARQAMTRLAEELARPWNEGKSDPETGYRPIPKGIDDPAYLRSLAAQVGARFGITLDHQEVGLSTAEDIAADPILGRADTPGDADEPLKLSDFALRVPGLYKPKKDDESSLRLQLFQTPQIPLTIAGFGGFEQGPDGRLRMKPGEPTTIILFRVIEARESQIPAVIDEVVQRVERDVRLQKAYARMETVANELCAVASRLGLDTALTQFEDLRTKRGVRTVTRTPTPFSRMTRVNDPQRREELLKEGKPPLEYTDVTGIGRVPEFIDACFEMTEEDWKSPTFDLPQSAAVQAATTQKALEPAPKVRTISIPRLHKRFVVELQSTTPVNTDTYANDKRQQGYNFVMSDRSLAARMAWYDPSAIEQRCDYKNLETEESLRAIQSYSPEPVMPFSY